MEIFALLRGEFPDLFLERDFSFARHTTVGCGGVAEVAASPADLREAERLLGFLAKKGIPHCFLGVGANVLASDGRYEGVVVRFRRLDRIGRKGGELFAEAGVTGGALCRFARAHGVGGMEPFTGIPMSVGGAVVMNAGVADCHMSDAVLRVVGYADGALREFSAEECRFAEKSSVFQDGIAVLYAVLRAVPSAEEEIAERTARYRRLRAHLPKGRSMGCTFVNPPGVSAGALIEACGLKGLCVGKARVSEAHANFIINEGNCASDVNALIAAVRDAVFARTGVRLREEIRRLP